MKVSARTDYALRAVIELAGSGDGPTSAVSLSLAQQIPKQFLDLILGDLRRAGMIVSQRGASGGFKLARPADEISIADVIRAVDGPLATVRGERPHDLAYEGSAEALQEVWIAVRAELRRLLEHVTLADVASGKLPAVVTDIVADAEVWK